MFLEEFNDNSKGWFSNPDTNILHAPNECIKIEDGQLKMHFERGLGIANCGGGWIEMELSDSTLNREEYFGKIGIKIKLSKGYFQWLSLIDSVSGGITSSHTLRNSSFHMQCGKHSVTFPLGYKNTDTIDLSRNLYQGSEFIFLSYEEWEWKRNRVYIDGEVIDYKGNTKWIGSSNNDFDFEFWVNIGYGQELMPHEIDLFIESIEIFTWEGEFCIDEI